MRIQRVQNNNYNTNFGMKYPIYRTKNVSSEFVKKVDKCLESLPDEWQEPLMKNKYNLFCSESIQDTFDRLSIPDMAPDWDAVTCGHPMFKFFVFTPKIEDNDLQRVINHEISHGIVNSEKLADKFDYVQHIFEDGAKFPYEEPNYKNLYDLKNLLINPIDDYRINEVFADIIAWAQKGGGLWGSGYKGSAKNPNFFKENYPSTYAKLKDFKPNQQEIEPKNEFEWGNDDDLPF